MSKYLIKLTPLEPYYFGTETGFAYPEEESTRKVSYFVKSGLIPSQTTILGLIRYLVLSGKGLLKSDFNYSKEERTANNLAIGPKSFKFISGDSASYEEQDFGCIKSISPLFFIKGDDIYIKNPFNNKPTNSGYNPIILGEKVETSNGFISLPADNEYDAKKGYGAGYINIRTKEIEMDLFKIHVLSSNKKNDKNEDETDAFFKREVIELKKDFSFAVYVEAEDLPKTTIAYMGGKKSTFQVSIEEDNRDTLDKQVEESFKGNFPECYYALSDLYVDKEIQYNAFCIVQKKYQRNLQTNYDADNHLKRYEKNVRVNLIESGSIFYKDVSDKFANKSAYKIGYNHIVKLGGN